MSAAATAAGYLYASGRLRGRGARENPGHERDPARPERRPREVKVAVYAPEFPAQRQYAPELPAQRQYAPELPAQKPSRPAKTPEIRYRVRRWRPE